MRMLVVLVVLAHAAIVEAQTRAVTFVFQNNFWLNLHQFVRGEAYRRSVKAVPRLDPASLGETDRATWNAAVDAYADFAKRDVLFDDELRALPTSRGRRRSNRPCTISFATRSNRFSSVRSADL